MIRRSSHLPSSFSTPAPPAASVVHRYRWWWWRTWHGMRLGDWLRLCAWHRFRVDPRRLHLAGSVTANAAVVSGLSALQRMVFGRRLERVRIEPPLLIIGHWRSGTTYLHELLTEDDRFTAPTSYECATPYHCLLSERLVRKLFRFMVPKRRPMDNVRVDWDAPQEDEIALATMGIASPYLSWAFPNDPPVHSEYLDFDGVSGDEVRRWQRGLDYLLRLVSCRRPGRVVLKSPTHTGRIRLLSEMFPGAKFIHMVRNPLEMFPSTERLWNALHVVQGLQRPDPLRHAERVREYIFTCFERMYRAFRRDRPRLEPSSICDVRYEDLVRDPVAELRRVYAQLGLGDFQRVRPAIQAAVDRRGGYRTNTHQLDPAIAREIVRRWAWYFQHYGYPLSRAA